MKLAIFDMDGTILNTLDDLKNSLNYALGQCGFPLRTISEVRSFVGNGIRLLVERGVPDYATDEQIDRVFDLFNQHYCVHCADNTRPYYGITEAIETLRKNNIKTAVVSNKADYAVQSLCKQYFDGLFDYAVGARDGMRKKPYPDSVNEVLKNLGISKKEAVYIGDTEVDIETAKNSDIECICVEWGFRDREVLVSYEAKQIVSNASSLTHIILSM